MSDGCPLAILSRPSMSPSPVPGPMTLLRTLLAALFLAFLPASLHAQAAEPGALRVGQRVEVEYTPGSGRWLAATVTEVVNDGFAYKVSIAPGQGAAESQANIHFRRVRPASATARPAAPAPTPRGPARLAPGRYGCTEAVYSARTGGYEYPSRGTVVLLADGRYRYLAFQRPSEGRFRADAQGRVTFSGGHLNGGEGRPMEDRPGRFSLTTPAGRWTCGIMAGS